MELSAHLSVARTRVRIRELKRHGARRLDDGQTFVVASALGLPRLWHYTLAGVLDGFEVGLSRPNDGKPSTRLYNGLRAAREALAARADALVERRAPDASLQCLCVEAGELHALAAGPGRVYLHRGKGRPERLSPREAGTEGLLRGTPAWCSKPLQGGDLIMTGSLSAFSQTAVSHVGEVLKREPGITPKAVTSMLIEPAEKSGTGAVALAIRVKEMSETDIVPLT